MTVPYPDLQSLRNGWVALGAALGANLTTGLLAEAFRRIELETDDAADILRSARTDAQPGSLGVADTSTTERAALAGLDIQSTREDLCDAMSAARIEMATVVLLAQRLARLAPSEGKAHCESKVTEADCHNFASEHRDDVGTTVDSMCDSCWSLACPTCHTRAAKARYGNRCEPCYHRAQRALRTTGEVA